MGKDNKPFLTIEEQIELLRERGLHVPEERLEEVRIKSLLAYYHAEKYGAMGYNDINTFRCIKDKMLDVGAINTFLAVRKKAEQQKKRMTETENFLKHFREKHDNKIPFWAYVEVMTISDISKLYEIAEEDIQKKIAKEFGYDHSSANVLLANLLHSVTIVRNICAHGGRLYNRNFIRKPKLSREQKQLLRMEKDERVYDRFFSYILVMKALALSEDFTLLKEHLLELTEKYPFVDMRYYGFPDNWKDVL